MNLKEAFDFVASQRPAWVTPKGNWNKPFIFNREHCLRLLGETTNVKKITKANLAAMRAALMQEPGKKGRRSAGGVNRIMSLINTVLAELEENEIIDKAPKLKPLKENGARTGWFTRKNIEDLVTVSREVYFNHELGDAILFGVYTGCRQGELLGLEVGDVSLDRKIITFRDTKNGLDHVLDIHEDLFEMLQMRCQGEDPSSKVFQFSNKDELYRAFKKSRKCLGLSDDLVWHSIRHTCGTWLAEAGVPIQTIAKILGHQSISTTERYVKTTDHARREALNKL